MKNCTYVFRTLLSVCVLAIAGFMPVKAQQIEKGITSANGDFFGFLEYKPVDYNIKAGTTKYPIIIFLHGIGERGNGTTELAKVACCGIPRLIKAGNPMRFTWNGKTETFLVISPQCPKTYTMWPQVFIDDLINYAKQNLSIDTNRIYLTGLSMGAGGSLRYISNSPVAAKKPAAVATICAPCNFNNGQYVADAKLPYWGFHAAGDTITLPTCTERAYNRIMDNNPEVKPLKTIWPTGGHNVWDRVYTDLDYRWDGTLNIYEWFLGQNKSLPPNKIPKANAGNTLNVTTGTGVAVLNASASTDVDGKIIRYVWRKLAGPAAGAISTIMGSSSTTTVTGLTIAGTYQFQLSVVDDRSGFSKDTLTVIVSNGTAAINKPPVAKAGTDITITLPTNTVNLSGAASTDEDGNITSYLWSKVSGPLMLFTNPSGATTDINNLVEGTYVIKLRVTDNKGLSAEDQITITVKPQPVATNVPPVAKAGNDVNITLPVNTVNLNGNGSTDQDGTIDSYLWSKVSGPAMTIATPNTATTDINDLVEGTYVIKLRVADDKGAFTEDQVSIIVKPAPVIPNVSPVARAGTDVTIILPVNTVNLNGSGSTDQDGTIDSYLWSKVSGPALTIASPSAATTAINNLVEGTYIIKLRVTDNKGAFTEDQVAVIVKPAPVIPNVSPVARAGSDVTITLPVNTANLNGSGSTDQDGTIAIYLWSKVSGPAITIATPYAATTAINDLVEGTYVIKLKVTDNKGAFTEDQVTVIVKPAPVIPNISPVARAGSDVTITLPVNTANLNGNGSTDEDGTIASYLWSKVSGPAMTIATPSAVSTSINNLVEGTYVIKLKVTDNKGAFTEDQVTVTVKPAPVIPNISPVARAGSDVTITLPVNTANLNGNGSTDEDGTIASYLWSKVSGPAMTIATPSAVSTSINNLVEGTYVIKLRVTDNKGAFTEDQVTVTVKPAPVIPNISPVARAGSDVTITLPVNTANLNGNGSTDEDGTIASYLWSKVSGPAMTIATPSAVSTSINNLVEGTYVIKLRVTDNKGAYTEDQVTVIVKPAPVIPNVPPVAKAGNDLTITLPVNKTTVNGSSSTDSDGSIVTYAWTKVTGPPQINIVNAAAASTEINTLVEGTYTLRLTVTDNKGAKSEDMVTIKVNPAPNVSPVSNAGNDIIITLPVNKTTLMGNHSADSDGTITTYLWTKISGPSQFIIADANVVNTNLTNLIEGSYKFRLLVTDNDGAQHADTVTVVVNPEPPTPNKAPVAQAGNNKTITLPVDSVTLDGSSSADSDGMIASYSWNFISGPNSFAITEANAAITSVKGLVVGTYAFRLEVIDNDGAADTDTVVVNVKEEATPPPPPNVAPVAKAGSDITITLPVNEASLDGSTSSDVDGTISNYTWSKVSGPASIHIVSPTLNKTLIENLVVGTYYFRLQVKDNDGALSSDTIKVTVFPAENIAPVANAGVDFVVQLPDPSINLDGTNSYDPDGTIDSYSWVKVSGPGGVTITNSSTATPGIVGISAGEFVFRLTVTDNDGVSASDVVTLTVLPEPPPPPANVNPVADAGPDHTINYPESSVTLDGSKSKDEDGTITYYTWTMISGTSQPVIETPGGASTIVSDLTTGDYAFELYIIDDKGAVSRDTVSISVVNTMRYEETLTVYPNPARAEITARMTSDTMGLSTITVYNAAGVIVKAVNTEKSQAQLLQKINVSTLQNGIYYVEVIIAGKQRKITKFIKQQ